MLSEELEQAFVQCVGQIYTFDSSKRHSTSSLEALLFLHPHPKSHRVGSEYSA